RRRVQAESMKPLQLRADIIAFNSRGTEYVFQAKSVTTQEATADPEPSHSRLAREIREMSGLPTGTLAAALGVSREQYSRWISGKPISTVRHGQLQFLHTLLRDLNRRVGVDAAKVWFVTPDATNRTPVDLLVSRRFDLLHALIANLADQHPPVVDGVIVALASPMDVVDEDDDGEDGEPWTPDFSGG